MKLPLHPASGSTMLCILTCWAGLGVWTIGRVGLTGAAGSLSAGVIVFEFTRKAGFAVSVVTPWTSDGVRGRGSSVCITERATKNILRLVKASAPLMNNDFY